MALYIACSLLALLVVQSSTPGSRTPTPQMMFLTGAGLASAHVLAFSVSTRMVSSGRLDAEALLLRTIQASAGLGVSALAALSVAVAPVGSGARWTAIGLLTLIGGSGFLAARAGGASVWRALLYVAVVWSVLSGVMVIKLAH